MDTSGKEVKGVMNPYLQNGVLSFLPLPPCLPCSPVGEFVAGVNQFQKCCPYCGNGLLSGDEQCGEPEKPYCDNGAECDDKCHCVTSSTTETTTTTTETTTTTTPACNCGCTPKNETEFIMYFSPPDACHTKADVIAPCQGQPAMWPTVPCLNQDSFADMQKKCCPEKPYTPYCGNGIEDADEDCGEPELPPCGANKYCDECKCVECSYGEKITEKWSCQKGKPFHTMSDLHTVTKTGDPKPQCPDQFNQYITGPFLCDNKGGNPGAAANGAPAGDIAACCKLGCQNDAECPDPNPPRNDCWTPGAGCCVKDGLFGPLDPADTYCDYKEKGDPNCVIAGQIAGADGMGRSYIGEMPCKPSAPTADSAWTEHQVKDGCELSFPPTSLPGGGMAPGTSLMKYDASCSTKCEKQCLVDLCNFMPLHFFASFFGNVPIWAGPTGNPSASLPINVWTLATSCPCPRGTHGHPPVCTPCEPGATDAGCPCAEPYTGNYPDCACPAGTVGTPPNCVACPTGSTAAGCPCPAPGVGSYPNCQCPQGMRGTPPNCVACEPGSTARGCPCPAPASGTYPDCACPAGTIGIPPDCQQAPPDCVAAGTCPPPCQNPPCTSPPCTDCTPVCPNCNPPPVPTPVLAPPPVVPPEIFCAVAQPAEGITITAGNGGEINASTLPAGYEVISVTHVTCAGNNLDLTFNVPDHFTDIRAFLARNGSAGGVPAQSGDSPQCGGHWTQDTRNSEVSGWRNTTYTELEAITEVQQVFAPTDAERIVSTGDYSVELPQELQDQVTVTLSSPTFAVPQPGNPSLIILGTPLLAAFSPRISGDVLVTLPYRVPDHVDPYSVGIYALQNGNWVPLTAGFDADKRHVFAHIGNLTPFLDDTGKAVFASMGVACIACSNATIERVYNGGSRKAVFLVHGFTTDRLRWQSLIDDIALSNSDWQIWAVSYPLATDSDHVAEEISSLIEQNAAKFDKASFITHSIGGIIVQKALKDGNDKQFAWPRKAADVIMAGQPGTGSPSADVYGRLFATLVNLKSSAMVWNGRSPLITEAVAGAQVERAPGAEYFIIAGNQPYPFTADLFKQDNYYLPNDGIVSIYSARTVGNAQIIDRCRHYFEVPRTHTDLLDDWLPRRVMERLLFRNDNVDASARAIAGYNKYVHVQDNPCASGALVLIGKRISAAQTEAPLGCNCGNGVCGEGENALNCPQDCVEGYQYRYFCRVMPWIIGPLVAVLLLLTTFYVSTAIKTHRRSEAIFWISMVAALTALLLIGHYLFCGFTVPLAVLTLGFIIALLALTMGHLHAERPGKTLDDGPIRQLERLLGSR